MNKLLGAGLVLLGLVSPSAAFAESLSQSTNSTQNNNGSVTLSPSGGTQVNNNVNNAYSSTYSFGVGISCPTPSIALNGFYGGSEASGGNYGGAYGGSISYIMPLGGDVGRSCREHVEEITKQRQLDTQVNLVKVCADFARQGIVIDTEAMPEFAICLYYLEVITNPMTFWLRGFIVFKEKGQPMSHDLLNYTNQLARKVQSTWEDSVRADYTKRLQTATSSEQRDNLREQLHNIHEGQFDFGRNYRVRELEDRYQIVYDDETGATGIHCVSKETGDVARHCIKLVEEPFFQFNILYERSRTDCISQAHWNREYLL